MATWGKDRRLALNLWERMKKPKSKLLRWLLGGLGILSLALGVTGIFVPLLPTTPFLLLAAACFLRSSEKLHLWLLNHKWLGPYIRNYQEYKALPYVTKFWTLLLMWSTIGYAVLRVLDSWALRALLLLIAAGVTAHILSLKTLTEEMRLEAKTDTTVERESCDTPSMQDDCRPQEERLCRET